MLNREKEEDKYPEVGLLNHSRWVDKENVVYTYMEYYLVLKKKEILQYVTTWMNLEDIMLSEISQLQKDKCCIFQLHEGSKVVKFIESKSGVVAARAWGVAGNGESLTKRHKVSAKQDE